MDVYGIKFVTFFIAVAISNIYLDEFWQYFQNEQRQTCETFYFFGGIKYTF